MSAGGRPWRSRRPRKDDPPDIYATTAEARSTDGFRLIWFRSSQKAALDAAARRPACTRSRRSTDQRRWLPGLEQGPQQEPNGGSKENPHDSRRRIAPCSGSRQLGTARDPPHPSSATRPAEAGGRRFESLVPASSLRSRSAVILRPFEQRPGPMRVFPLLTNLDARVPQGDSADLQGSALCQTKRHALFKTERRTVAPVYLRSRNGLSGFSMHVPGHDARCR